MWSIYVTYVALPMFLVAVLISVMTYFTKREDPLYKFYLLICLVTLGWGGFQLLSLASQNYATAEFYFHMIMLFVPFVPVVLLTYVIKFAKIKKLNNIKFFLAICIIPIVSVILNFTNQWHGLFREEFAVLANYPVRELLNVRGPWFWVHVAYSYALTMATILLVASKMGKIPRPQRLPYYVMFVGCATTAAFNAFALFVGGAGPIDVTLWGLTFSLFFFYFAMDTSPSSSFVLARNEVFESLGEHIFVLNTDGKVIDMNDSSVGWMQQHGVPINPNSIKALLASFQEKGAIVSYDDEQLGQELIFPAKEGSLFSSYAIKEQPLKHKKRGRVGTIITFSDVTRISESLRKLQYASTIDSLTGVHNRRSYEEQIEFYSQNNELPLCVIIGDINGLKKVNDSMGHQTGDEVLRTAARILADCAGDKNLTARIGGDEFIVLAPRFSEADAEAFIRSVRASFSRNSDLLHGAGIALGYTFKTDLSQDIDSIIAEADRLMYQDKSNDRRQGR